MVDLIDRQAVLELPRNITRNFFGEIVEESIDINRIKALPSAQPKQRWIPVSEGLPKPNEEDADGFIKAYLVQDGRWMDVARWNGDWWVACGYGTALPNVTAWMPLPEPYKEVK